MQLLRSLVFLITLLSPLFFAAQTYQGRFYCIAAALTVSAVAGPPFGNELKPRRWHGSDAIQELKHSDGQERGRIRVVRRQRAIGEVVLIPGVQEKLRVLDLLHNLAGGVDVALADEDRVIVHSVDLGRDAVRPGSEGPLAADRQARVEE